MSHCKKCDGPTLAEMADELEAKALKEVRAVVGSVMELSHFDGRARDVLAALRIVEHLRAASGTLTEGGDVEQAPGDSLSGPPAESRDAQDPSQGPSA